MKKTYILLSVSIVISGFSLGVFAQPSTPPVLPEQHGINGNVSQNAAPLEDGADVLILLGAAYVFAKGLAGIRKITAGTLDSRSRNGAD